MHDDLPSQGLKTGSKRITKQLSSYEEHLFEHSDDDMTAKKQRLVTTVKPKKARKSSRSNSKTRSSITSTTTTTGHYNLRSRNSSISESTVDSDTVSVNSCKSKVYKDDLVVEDKNQLNYSPFIVEKDHMLTMDQISGSASSKTTTSTLSNGPDHFQSLDVDNKKFIDGRSLWKSNYSQIFRRSENVQSMSRQTYLSQSKSSFAEGDTIVKTKVNLSNQETIQEKPTFIQVSNENNASLNYDASLGSQWAKTSTTPQGTRHTEIRVINCCPPGHHYLKDHKLSGTIWSYLILLRSYLLSIVKFPFVLISRILSFCLKRLWSFKCLWILLPFLILPFLFFGFSSLSNKSSYLQVPNGQDIIASMSSFMNNLEPKPQVLQPNVDFDQNAYNNLEKQINDISRVLKTVMDQLEESKNKEDQVPAKLTDPENEANKLALIALQKELTSVKEKMSSFEKSTSIKKDECCSLKIQNIDGHNLAVDLDLMFREKLAVFASDMIGMPDFALESAGGSIHCVRDTQTYSVDAPTYNFFGFPAIILKRSPYMVLDSKILPGECWPFVGDKGAIVIRLSEPIYITAITIDHAPRILNENYIIDTAPKDFSVHVMKEVDTDGLLVLNGTYDKEQKNYSFIQTFLIEDDKRPKYPVRFVEVKILSNHGNPNFTCIYRIRVHGSSAFTAITNKNDDI